MMIIIHHSASSFGNASLINEWHIERGFKHIGYHFVILNGCLHKGVYNSIYDGMVETGRAITDKGAHCYGYNNSIGICLIADKGDEITEPQEFALYNTLEKLNDKYGKLEIFQHSDFDNKKPYCAGLHPNFLKELNKKYS